MYGSASARICALTLALTASSGLGRKVCARRRARNGVGEDCTRTAGPPRRSLATRVSAHARETLVLNQAREFLLSLFHVEPIAGRGSARGRWPRAHHETAASR